jgi:hypothetical protein
MRLTAVIATGLLLLLPTLLIHSPLSPAATVLELTAWSP